MALPVAIVEPIQIWAVPLAALALVAAALMTAFPHLPLKSASGRLLALQDLDGTLMVALLGPPPALQLSLDSDAQPLKLLRGGVLDLQAGQHPCLTFVLCSVWPQHTGYAVHRTNLDDTGGLPLDSVLALQENREIIACARYGWWLYYGRSPAEQTCCYRSASPIISCIVLRSTLTAVSPRRLSSSVHR
jgi:hypothetical protein